MGFFKQLLGFERNPAWDVLDESIARLRLGIFARLFRKFSSVYGEDQGKFLAVAVMNSALLEDPTNDKARVYLTQNREFI